MKQFDHHVEDRAESGNKGAVFSPCREYRYLLWRSWDGLIPEDERASVAFVGINPSTAGAANDDATIRRVVGFSKSFGYSTVYMLNLCPLISTQQSGLKNRFSVSEENLAYLREFTNERVASTVCAWGAGVGKLDRYVVQQCWNAIGRPTYCLGTTNDGHPKHPLRLPRDTALRPFNRLPVW